MMKYDILSYIIYNLLISFDPSTCRLRSTELGADMLTSASSAGLRGMADSGHHDLH